MNKKSYQQNEDGSIKYSPTGYGTTVFHDVVCPKCGYRNPDISQGMSKCSSCGYDLLPGNDKQ